VRVNLSWLWKAKNQIFHFIAYPKTNLLAVQRANLINNNTHFPFYQVFLRASGLKRELRLSLMGSE
jgi:hypothetical protein